MSDTEILIIVLLLVVVVLLVLMIGSERRGCRDLTERIEFLEKVLQNVEQTVFTYDLPIKGGFGTSGFGMQPLGHSLHQGYRPAWKQPRGGNGRFKVTA